MFNILINTCVSFLSELKTPQVNKYIFKYLPFGPYTAHLYTPVKLQFKYNCPVYNYRNALYQPELLPVKAWPFPCVIDSKINFSISSLPPRPVLLQRDKVCMFFFLQCRNIRVCRLGSVSENPAWLCQLC